MRGQAPRGGSPGGGALAATYLLRDELTSVSVGSDAPGFLAKTVDPTPRTKSLSDYRGDVVLLNIWATYCIPCRTEMPSIEAVYQELGPKGLKVVAVSVDATGFEQQIRDFVRDYNLSFDILYDDTGAIDYRAEFENKIFSGFTARIARIEYGTVSGGAVASLDRLLGEVKEVAAPPSAIALP